MEDLKCGCLEYVIIIAWASLTLLRLLSLLLIFGLLRVCSTALSLLLCGTIYFLYLLVFQLLWQNIWLKPLTEKKGSFRLTVLWAHRAQSVVAGRHKASGHNTLITRIRGLRIPCFLLWIQSRTSGHGRVLPKFKVSLPTSVLNHFESLHWLT